MNDLATPDSEITLVFHDQRAVVSPWGASLRRYFLVQHDGREIDILWGYSGGRHKKGGQGDVLIPFPGRVAGGRYQFDGHRYQLECNDKEGPNAIHGFVRTMHWQVSRADPAHVSFKVRLEAAQYGPRGYPFSLAVEVTYLLNDRGLSCSFAVRNVGRTPAPVGVGFHPYFTVGTDRIDDAEVEIPAAAYLAFEHLVPTGAVISVTGMEWDYRRCRRIGDRRFNHCYMDLERDSAGTSIARLRNELNGRSIDIHMDRSFTAVVLYTGDAIADAPRRALAIEPMTCGTDAFNHPEWGLKRLEPEETFTGRYAVVSQGI